MSQVKTPPRSIRRYLRFSLRAFLILVALVGAGFGWLAMRVQHARHERAAIAAIGKCQVFYDYQRRSFDYSSDENAALLNTTNSLFAGNFVESKVYDSHATPPGPVWLRKWLGDDILANVECVDIAGEWRPKNLVPDQVTNSADSDEIRSLQDFPEERSLAPLAELSNLEVLVLGSDVAPGDLQDLVGLKSLKILVLNGISPGPDAGFPASASQSGLRGLVATGDAFSNQDLQRFGNIRRLTYLSLANTDISDEGMPFLRELRNIETLSLRETAVGDDGIAACAEMTKLRRLDLFRAPMRGIGFDDLQRLTNLKVLELGSSQVDDVGLEFIGKFTSLIELDLSKTKISNAGLASLATLRRLRRLDLGKNRISDEGLGFLSQLTELRRLDLDSTEISDRTLAQIARLTKLEHLGLNSTQVTDAGLAHLHGLSSLEELQVAFTQMTDVGLEYVRQLPKLRKLDLFGTGVSYEALISIKATTPTLDLHAGSRREPLVAPALSEVDWTQPDDEEEDE